MDNYIILYFIVDDIVLIGESVVEVNDRLEEWREALKKKGLRIIILEKGKTDGIRIGKLISCMDMKWIRLRSSNI